MNAITFNYIQMIAMRNSFVTINTHFGDTNPFSQREEILIHFIITHQNKVLMDAHFLLRMKPKQTSF